MRGGDKLDQTFFLAANSGDGFFSLYDAFPGKPHFLHIIKGGPGTGKSGFMRRIRREAQARGLDALTVLCSGDPDSLDGLLIPALGQAWVDGTAPHVREPRIFGVDSDYINLGRFCTLPLSERDRERAQALHREYKERYAAAYRHLDAAEALERSEQLPDAVIAQEEIARICTILDGFPDRREGVCIREKRFISAITCQGVVELKEAVNSLCKQYYYLRGDSSVLEQAAALAEKKTGRILLCLRPLNPRQLEAVLLPDLDIAFLRSPAPLPVPAGERLLSREALSRAVTELREAKALHDKLEAVYRPYMDFASLTAYTGEYVKKLFG